LKQYFLNISIVILLSACIPEQKPIDPPTVAQQEEQAIDDSDDRAYWQKPHLVLQKIGNLEETVVADIGAGMGYFTFELASKRAKKVIAIDIDKEMIEFLNLFKNASDFGSRVEVRHATPDDPKIAEEEVDVILIVNTIAYIENKIEYLSNLRTKLKENGKIIIVDFKTKRLPEDINAPDYENRVYLHLIEEEMLNSGFTKVVSDDTSLDYQYIVEGYK
jgi:2-polyprenyl-3-methyl-5-hydroxy-6-metoxy-1,4-benzoquinol methylase